MLYFDRVRITSVRFYIRFYICMLYFDRVRITSVRFYI